MEMIYYTTAALAVILFSWGVVTLIGLGIELLIVALRSDHQKFKDSCYGFGGIAWDIVERILTRAVLLIVVSYLLAQTIL